MPASKSTTKAPARRTPTKAADVKATAATVTAKRAGSPPAAKAPAKAPAKTPVKAAAKAPAKAAPPAKRAARNPGPQGADLDLLTWEKPPTRDRPDVPTREQIAEALSRAPQHWAVVLRADRAVRAASAVERITTGREYGEGFEAVARRVGPEHRVYARCVRFAG